ncbi:MAG TPA: hypothetical protein VMV69_15710 [Pirellulales bacterium]|nr:hypothetical protein [Pirellulales bacterium]
MVPHPMPETWLRTNPRLLWVAAVWPCLLSVAGLTLATGLLGNWDLFGLLKPAWLRGFGWLLTGFAGCGMAFLAWQARRPRLARDGAYLLVYLRAGDPLRVPLDVVEGFLLGQGPSFLPARRGPGAAVKTVVIRLTERAAEWAQRDVQPELGSWCGHYVTIRGTWCEPISVELLNRLNERLAESRRQ